MYEKIKIVDLEQVHYIDNLELLSWLSEEISINVLNLKDEKEIHNLVVLGKKYAKKSW